MVKVYHDPDINEKVLDQRKVAVIGYGSQGRAQSLNMRDSGVDVVVGLRPGSSWKRAEADGLQVPFHESVDPGGRNRLVVEDLHDDL